MDGYHYYVNIYFKGLAPKKLSPGKGRCGIDPGVSTVAASGEKNLMLKELAPEYKKYDKEIHKLQQYADVLRRKLNPGNYNDDGTIRRLHKGEERIWIESPKYKMLMKKIRILYRKKSSYIEQSHNKMCNELITYGDCFFVEDMDFKSLMKRAKETSRSDRTIIVTDKNGNPKSVVRFKKKKRFGCSINSRAPSEFLLILERKCKQYGSRYYTTNARTMKASQYDHTSDTCKKVPLSQRKKTLSDGSVIQRDLYSAFLHQHVNDELKLPDRDSCIKDFPNFLSMQTILIDHIRESKQSYSCFGF